MAAPEHEDHGALALGDVADHGEYMSPAGAMWPRE
jgi:hypothetical protein